MSPTRPIVVGGLRGSGADLLPELLDQHPDVGIMTETREDETVVLEGQHRQSVFRPDTYFGGPGAAAFHPDAHLDPAAERWSRSDFERLRADWEDQWSDSADVGVEYSPSNVLRAPFLAEAFPDAVFVYVHRHPVLDALATRRETGDRSVPLAVLVRHWLAAHRRLVETTRDRDDCVVVSFEELRRRPGEVFDEIFAAAGLDPVSVDPSALRSVGRDAWIGWEELPAEEREPVYEFETEIGWFGYDLDGPDFRGDVRAEAVRGSGAPGGRLELAALRPDDAELTDLGPAGVVPDQLLFLAFGSRRDVEPVLAAAASFREHGYDVVVCSTEAHRRAAEAADVPFASVHPEASIDHPAPRHATEKEQLEAYYRELYRFYDAYGEAVVRTVADEVGRADCVLLGRGVFFRGLLAYYFRVPVVDIEDAPGHLVRDETAPAESVRRYAADVVVQAYGVSSFKIGEALDEAYRACDVEYRHTDEGFNESLVRAQSTRVLRQGGPDVQAEIPGLPDRATGFWLPDGSGGVTSLDADTRQSLARGVAPVCVDFATVDVFADDAPAWTDRLVTALEASDRPVIAIGEGGGEGANVEWVPPADAASVYRHCRLVVHDASPQTTVECAAAGTPAIAVPPVEWDRSNNWARWLERAEAGRHVRERDRPFEGPFSAVEDGRFDDGARALAERIEGSDGPARLVAAFEELFADPDEALTRDWRSMVYVNSLPIASWRKAELLAYPLFREADAPAAETLELREAFLERIDEASRRYPTYERDWPNKGEPLDLDAHDRPHETAGTEWWYYHTHLETESGRELSLFAVLFKRLFDDERFAHAHAGALDVDSGRHEQRSIGDPRAPDHVAPRLAGAPEDAYGRRALREVYEKGRYPDPDVQAAEPPTLPEDAVAFELGDLEIEKDGEDYLVALEADDSFGFSLRFSPRKPPVLHYVDGVMRGVTAGANMFYYSITRMDVDGHVVLDGERERVEGSGWYDHEFGGGREGEAALGGAHSWLWMGIQLADGSELGYTTVTNLDTGTDLHEDEILYVSPDGEKAHYEGSIERVDSWSSMHTYVEYGTAWRLEVPGLDLALEIEAVADRQEVRSVIARPAYWEGRIEVAGTREGESISGTGICEQYGQGGDRSDYREFLDDVSREVQRSVAEVLPYDVSREHMQRLIANEDHPELIEGVDEEVFVEAGVRPIRTMVDRGGKGWRSMALLLSAEICGEDPQKLQRYLALPELIHTGSLIVDDVQDNSTTRRGGPTCHEMFGEAIAINAGTASYFMGERLQEERETDFSDQQLLRLYQLHFLALRAGHAGQGADIYGFGHKIPRCLESGDFGEIWENVRAIHRLKSAVPAMVAARMGAVASGVDPETEEVLGDYFLALGYAFQLVDDAINLRGFEHDLKEHAEDLLEGKVTAPVARAFQVLDDAERRELWEHLSAPPEETDVAAILSLVEGCGAVDWCHDRAREVVEAAWQPVDEHFPESQAKMRLRAFGWFVVDVRDY